MPTKIKPSKNKEQWPRQKCETVECRKRDIVLRVTDWWTDRDEPAIDVEVYIGGVYDWHESQTFTKSVGLAADMKTKTGGYSKKQAKAAATQFAAEKLAKHL